MITHKITKGFDIPLAGEADRSLVDAPESATVAVEPTEFPGIKAKLLVKEGDEVETGQPLFFDKFQPETRWCSPATGRVREIVLGARRAVQRVVIERSDAERFASIPHVAAEAVGSTSREDLIEALCGAGLWSLIRQRPVGRTADPAATPVAIYVNGMDTEPLAADPAFALQGRGEDLQAGIDVLRRLTEGPVYVTVKAQEQAKEFQGLHGVELHAFHGPHPSGLPGTHIHAIRPMKAAEVCWTVRAQHAALIGEWVRTGHYPTHRIVAVAGTSAPERRYYRVRQGSELATVTGGAALGDDVRVIDGTVLSGTAGSGVVGFGTTTITAIPEGTGHRDLLGWMLPQPSRPTFHRAVTFLLGGGGKKRPIDTRLNGGLRGIVNIGAWEAVTPLDIYPTWLIRAIQANDLDEAIKLGLLEVTEEDVALCTYVDPCKIDVGAIVRQGLDLYRKEG